MKFIRSFLFLMLVAVILVPVGVANATTKDTPESVMAAAKGSMPDAQARLTLANEENAFLNRLSSDKAYAQKLLEAVQKKDANGVAAVVKETMRKSDVSVVAMEDFTLKIRVKVKTSSGTTVTVDVCVSNSGGCK